MIFLGIGSNLSSSFGDRFKNIDLAISFLESYKINIIKKSSLYEVFLILIKVILNLLIVLLQLKQSYPQLI